MNNCTGKVLENEIDIDISDYEPVDSSFNCKFSSINNSTQISSSNTTSISLYNTSSSSSTNSNSSETLINTTSCSIYSSFNCNNYTKRNDRAENLVCDYLNKSNKEIDEDNEKSNKKASTNNSVNSIESNMAIENAMRISKLKQSIIDSPYPQINATSVEKAKSKKHSNKLNKKSILDDSDIESITLLIKVPKNKLIDHIKSKGIKSKHQRSSSVSLISNHTELDQDSVILNFNRSKKTEDSSDSSLVSYESNDYKNEDLVIKGRPKKLSMQKKINLKEWMDRNYVAHLSQGDVEKSEKKDQEEDEDEETFSNITTLIDRSRHILKEYKKTLMSNAKIKSSNSTKITKHTQTDLKEPSNSINTPYNYVPVSVPSDEEPNEYVDYSKFNKQKLHSKLQKILDTQDLKSTFFLCNVCGKIVPSNLSPICERKVCTALNAKCDRIFHCEIDMIMHLPVVHTDEFSLYQICNRMYHPTHVVKLSNHKTTCLDCLESNNNDKCANI